MGGYRPTYDPLEAAPTRASQPLTRLERDEQCDSCRWPDLCAEDRTCWREESEVHRNPAARVVLIGLPVRVGQQFSLD